MIEAGVLMLPHTISFHKSSTRVWSIQCIFGAQCQHRRSIKESGQMNKARKMLVIASTVFSLLILFSEESVSGVRNNPNALRAIEEIEVVVKDLDGLLENCGLSRDQIRAEADSKLRIAGIKVSPDALPTLYVDINSYDYPKYPGLAVITVRIELYQFVYLPSPQEILWASTWSAESVAVSASPNVSEIKDLIKNHLDRFIHDYRSVNPKK